MVTAEYLRVRRHEPRVFSGIICITKIINSKPSGPISGQGSLCYLEGTRRAYPDVAVFWIRGAIGILFVDIIAVDLMYIGRLHFLNRYPFTKAITWVRRRGKLVPDKIFGRAGDFDM